MDRRSFITRTTAAALGTPLLGRFVVTNPQVGAGIESSGAQLLVPSAEPLVLATSLPARRVSGFSVYPDRWSVDLDRPISRLYDWDTDKADFIAGPATGRLSFEGMVFDPDDLNVLAQSFSGNGRTAFRFYVEPA